MGELEIGMVGLGVMGQNLALNIDEKGFSCAGWDAWPEPVDKFVAKGQREGAKQIQGFKDLKDFVASLRRPRRIILLVKAGEVVDKTIAGLLPLLEKDDMIVDSGNEYFHNTERRAKELAPKGIRFFGMGVSGGEEGARHGPSMMPGGDRAGYDDMAPILTKIAAQADGPCVTYCGPGGAGHYVKMVHNGIEYGDMQLIAETYDVLKNIGGLSNAELADTFDEWNRGELQSFLIEITANIFRKKDPESGNDLIDMIVDAAAAKGTGKWTVQDAAEIGSPIPVIASSVEARLISSDKAGRAVTTKLLAGPAAPKALSGADKKKLIADVRAALYCAKACSYAQGMNLLRNASNVREWGINLGELARIWKAGCIIRAQFLGRIKEAYDRDANLTNLLIDSGFRKELGERQDGWRSTVAQAVAAGVPVMAMSSALGYYDSIRRERLPANLTQAQRDYFGSHTYERIDKPGSFHTEWTAK
jgi:6-phosphogluconate dehydrogenase